MVFLPAWCSCFLSQSAEQYSNLSVWCFLWAQAVVEEKASRDPSAPPPKKEWSYFEAMHAVLKKQATTTVPPEVKDRDRGRTKRAKKTNSNEPQLQGQL